MSLHKILKNPEKKGRNVVVDHKDGNKLNNQKDNLRICSHAENMRNRKPEKDVTSIYKGVYWNKGCKKWEVQISQNSRSLKLGTYTDEIAAANVYNHFAKEKFGEFALINDNIKRMSLEECYKFKCGLDETSKYRGVSFADNKWIAQIYHEGKNIIIEKFINEIDAAIAYNEKASLLKGNKARLNII